MRGSLGIFLGCLILTILLVLTAAGLTLVVAQTNAATPMSANESDANYSAHAAEREAGTNITTMVVIFLWAAAILMVVVTFAMVATMFF